VDGKFVSGTYFRDDQVDHGFVLRGATATQGTSKHQTTQSTGTEIDISLRWPMDPAVYDLPLTLKVEGPSAWAHTKVTADGKDLMSRVRNQDGQTVILVDVVPNTKTIHIAPKKPST
jgi:hypothetical protein